MKAKRIIIIALCILSLLILSVYAHSGRTDSNGGHYNNSTGDYHYHTGEYAGRDSFGGTLWGFYFFIILIGVLFFVWLFQIQPYLPNTIVHYLENSIIDAENAIRDANHCYALLEDTKTKAIPPVGYEIGNDGLPKESNTETWGHTLTVYTVFDGWKLHLNRHCSSLLIKRHAYSFYNRRHSVCKNCAENYEIPNMEWYVEHLKIAEFEKNYEFAKARKKNALFRLQNSYKDSKTKRAKFFMFFSPKNKRTLNKLEVQYKKLMSYR